MRFQTRSVEQDSKNPAAFKQNAVDEVQRNITAYTKQVDDAPFIRGNIIENQNLTAGTPVSIRHRLKRIPTGWAVVDVNVGSSVFRTSWDTEFVTLDCTVNCIVNIYVF